MTLREAHIVCVDKGASVIPRSSRGWSVAEEGLEPVCLAPEVLMFGLQEFSAF